MANIERKKQDNGMIKMCTRISKGFDENGKRIRKQYTYEIDTKEYPTEELQNSAFNKYLISCGEQPLIFVEKENVVDTVTRKIISIPINEIVLNNNNIQYGYGTAFIERLAISIKEDGLNNPLHVIKNDNGTYTINKGNKRYLACKQLGHKEIECYVINDTQSVENEILDLRLLRDNVFTYERTIKDKILEVERYHTIAPKLKELGYFKKGERTNEFIAREMSISDKSVKDYVSIVKNKQVKEWFLNDKFQDLYTALELVKVAKDKDKFSFHIENLEKRLLENEDNKICGYMLNSIGWEYERELKKQEEKERKEDTSQEKVVNISCNNNEVNSDEKEEVEEKPYIKYDKTTILSVDVKNHTNQATVITLLHNSEEVKDYLLKIKWLENKVSFALYQLNVEEKENPLEREVDITLIELTFEKEYVFKSMNFINMIYNKLDIYHRCRIYLTKELEDFEEYFPNEFGE